MRSLLGVLFVLGACGGDDGVGKLPDAPLFGSDAPLGIDAPSAGLVKLTITQDANPQPGVRVYFQNADSTVVSATTTDAAGVASATMEPGGYVTAIDPFNTLPLGLPPATDVRTFAGVKPGDSLVLHQVANQPLTDVKVLVPLDPNAVSYLLYTSCGTYDITNNGGSDGSGGPGGLMTLFGCGATTDFVVEAHDVNNIAISSFTQANVALVQGGTIDLTAATYAATQDVTWSYSNVPAGIGSFNITGFLTTPNGTVVNTFSSAIVNNGSATTTGVKRPVVPGALSINSSRFFGGNFSLHSVVEWGPASQTNTLDLASVLLPEYADLPAYGEVAHSVVWTVNAGGGARPDFARVQMSVNRPSPTLNWNWEIVGPTPTDTIVFPVLPAPDDQLNPNGTDNVQVNGLVTARVPGGYDAVRANALANQGFETVAVGASGRAVFQELSRGKVIGQRPAPRHATLLPHAHTTRSAR